MKPTAEGGLINRDRPGLTWFAFLVGGGVLFFLNLSAFPPLSWDEGWTFAVARNFLETGHYGQLRAGVTYPPGLSASFPVVLPIVLSFKLFGIGIWQGRVPGLLCAFGVLYLLYRIAGSLFDRRTARMTLCFLLTLPLTEQIHPLLFGRQALGEMTMLLFLLLGFLSAQSALSGKPAWLIPAGLAWALALQTKVQPVPFLLAAFLLVTFIALWKRNRIWWKVLAPLGVLTYAFYWIFGRLFFYLFLSGPTGSDPVEGLLGITALVFTPFAREGALFLVFTIGLSTAAGLVHFLFHHTHTDWTDPAAYARWMYFLLAAGWMAWFAAFSINWTRYFLPPLFLGGVFGARIWDHLLLHFGLRKGLAAAAAGLRRAGRNAAAWKALAGLLFLTVHITLFVFSFPLLPRIFVQDDSLQQTAAYLNEFANPGALVETYDSPILFLLEMQANFPPNQVHVEVNRRVYLAENIDIDYDPLAADPDYLVLGPIGRQSGLYTSAIAAAEFVLDAEFSTYEVYRSRR